MFSLSIIRLFLVFVVISSSAFAQFAPGSLDDASIATASDFSRGPMFMDNLTQRCSLSGRVRDSAGAPTRNAKVEVESRESGHVVFSGYASPNGTFQVANLPEGNYEVIVNVGLAETRESVSLEGSDQDISITLPNYNPASNGRSSISLAELRVPERARNAFRKAQEAAHKEKLDDAEKYIAEALQAYPHYANALTLRGILRLNANQFGQASQDLEQAIHFDPNYPLAYLALGSTYNLLSRWDDALRALECGSSLVPTSWQTYFEMGKAFLGKGNYESALQQFNKAQELNPQYSLVHMAKAHALVGIKNYANAITELETYLKDDPNGSAAGQARETLDKVRAYTASNAPGH